MLPEAARRTLERLALLDPPRTEGADARWLLVKLDGGPEKSKWAPPRPPSELDGLSVDELVIRFVDRATARDATEYPDEMDDIYWQLDEVVDQLERREGDGHSALVALYADPRIEVRQQAAEWTETIEPELSRMRLKAIFDAEWTADAGPDGVPPGETRRLARLGALSTGQIVEQFAEMATEAGEHAGAFDVLKTNRFHWPIKGLVEELQRRGEGQLGMLEPLLRHRRANVRLEAGTALLETLPEKARAALQRLVDHHEEPQATYARGLLNPRRPPLV